MTPPILVAVDPRRDDPAPLALGLLLARLAAAPLLLAAAYPTRPADRLHPELSEALLVEAEDALARAAARLHDAPGTTPPIELRPVGAAGATAHVLHELAADEEPLLVVLGPSSHGGLGRVSPGAVTDRLLHRAPCAVAVVLAGAEEPLAAALRAGRAGMVAS